MSEKTETATSTEKPEWYEFEGWDEGYISFEDFVPGVKVRLEDVTEKNSRAIQRHIKTKHIFGPNGEVVRDPDGEPLMEVDADDAASAALAKGHIAGFEGDEEAVRELFPETPPDNAKPEKWENWVLGLKSKVLTRLIRGIFLFRGQSAKESGDEGNE